MNFLSRIIRYLFLVVVVAWGFRLLRWLLGRMLGETGNLQARSTATAENGSSQAEPEGPQQIARRLVRDPVCGTHVAEVLAIPLREGSETVHFCSVQCREAYAGSTRKFAANG